LASLATQGVCAGAQVRGGLPPDAYTGYGINYGGPSCLLADNINPIRKT
jgi:hypothetical protein